MSMNPPTTAPDASASSPASDAASTSLTLVPPQPVAAITPDEAAGLVWLVFGILWPRIERTIGERAVRTR